MKRPENESSTLRSPGHSFYGKGAPRIGIANKY